MTYLDGLRLQGLVIAHNKGDDANDDEIARAITLLARNIVYSWKFKCDRENAIQEAVLGLWLRLHKYDESKGKFFNWATTLIINELRRSYRYDKIQIDLKLALLDRIILEQNLDGRYIKRFLKGREDEE